MNRRGFLQGILAAGFAPAVGHAGILMPVKKILTQEYGEDGWVRFTYDPSSDVVHVYKNGIFLGAYTANKNGVVTLPVAVPVGGRITLVTPGSRV